MDRDELPGRIPEGSRKNPGKGTPPEATANKVCQWVFDSCPIVLGTRRFLEGSWKQSRRTYFLNFI